MKDKKVDYDKLKEFRKSKKISQKEMAKKLNIEQSSYSKIENGERGMRTEQLTLIAEKLEIKIHDLLIRVSGTKSDLEPDIKAEYEFLKPMIQLLSTIIEAEIHDIYYRYEHKYPLHLLSFEEYLVDEHSGPRSVVMQIKEDIEDYKKDNTFEDYYKDWYKQGIKYFIGKSDEWLLKYAMNEKYYDINICLIGYPSYIKPEDMMTAFGDMLKENPLVHKLFQYGLLEKSWYSGFWKKYLSEKKFTLTGDGHHEHEKFPEYDKNGKCIFPPKIDVKSTEAYRKKRELIRAKMYSVIDNHDKNLLTDLDDIY